eukprot:scaffold179354_cov18-Tisochrysis_lutea.AAC.1
MGVTLDPASSQLHSWFLNPFSTRIVEATPTKMAWADADTEKTARMHTEMDSWTQSWAHRQVLQIVALYYNTGVAVDAVLDELAHGVQDVEQALRSN